MRSRFSLIVRSIVIAVAAFALLLVGLREASALAQGVVAHEKGVQAKPDGDGPIVQVTERITIPYGFDAALPLAADGSIAAVSGQGACTAGDTITITFVVTQTSGGPSANGVWNGECMGQLQRWIQAPTATPSPNFDAGEAVACATAVTSADEPDLQEWCDPVFLMPYHNYLPHIQAP